MLVSTEEDTIRVLLGWVDVGNMRPGETVSVQISTTGQHNLYAGADPPNMIFDRDGRQYFNLTITLLEDSPITDYFELMVTAIGKTVLDQAVSDVELTIYPIFQISATANLVLKPNEAGPGEEVTGMVKITNTGSIYGEYRLTKVSDPDSVVDELAFTREAELTPGFYEDFEFRIRIADDAPPGEHQITVEVWASTQYDTGNAMDTFTVQVTVSEEAGIGIGSILVSSIVIIAVIVIGAFVLRRKA
jgi:uncharacterized membrane protein